VTLLEHDANAVRLDVFQVAQSRQQPALVAVSRSSPEQGAVRAAATP
jgi:hypothetical protein